MKTQNIEIVKRYEGLRLESYLCPAGVWTIGYGHTKGVSKGMAITETQAVLFLYEDIAAAEKTVNANTSGLTQNQFDALVSFCFNVGSGNFRRSTLLRLVKANPSNLKIYSEFTKWVYAAGKQLRGLLNRRIEEANLYFEK